MSNNIKEPLEDPLFHLRQLHGLPHHDGPLLPLLRPRGHAGAAAAERCVRTRRTMFQSGWATRCSEKERGPASAAAGGEVVARGGGIEEATRSPGTRRNAGAGRTLLYLLVQRRSTFGRCLKKLTGLRPSLSGSLLTGQPGADFTASAQQQFHVQLKQRSRLSKKKKKKQRSSRVRPRGPRTEPNPLVLSCVRA